MKRLYVFILIAVFSLCGGMLAKGGFNASASGSNFRLGTVVNMQLGGASKSTVDKALKAADSELVRLENIFSANIASSDVSRIGKNGGEWCEISEETYSLLKFSLDIAQQSDGAFDISIGRVSRLWAIGSENPRVPSKDELAQALACGNFKDVKIKEENKKFYAKAPEGMMIDLGGAAKGRIADILVPLIKAAGVPNILIDLGGNIAVAGKSSKGSAWKIGIQNPTGERGSYFGTVTVNEGSVVTSGAYERFFDADGKRYHHIFDPKTGMPAENEIASVSVIDKSSTLADTLCTALFVMGRAKAEDFLRSKDIAAVIVIKEQNNKYKAILTKSAKKIFKLTDNSFELKVISDK